LSFLISDDENGPSILLSGFDSFNGKAFRDEAVAPLPRFPDNAASG
jgi:hypothetical protein